MEQKIIDLQCFLFLTAAAKLLRLDIIRAEIRFLSRSQKAVNILADFKKEIACLLKISGIFFFEKFRRSEINRIGKVGKKLTNNRLNIRTHCVNFFVVGFNYIFGYRI